MRFMMFVKHAENRAVPPKSLMDAITKLIEEETKAGTMIVPGAAPHVEGCQRSSKGRENRRDRRTICRGEECYQRLRAVRTEIQGSGRQSCSGFHGASPRNTGPDGMA